MFFVKYFIGFVSFIAICLTTGENKVNANEAINVYAMPAIIKYSPYDHTYACVGNRCYAINNSRNYGGWNIINTNIGNKTYSIKSQCYALCYMKYASNGVCHQHTNRILYHTGKTLLSSNYYHVFGYNTSRFLFGVYGDKKGPSSGKWNTCFVKCNG